MDGWVGGRVVGGEGRQNIPSLLRSLLGAFALGRRTSATATSLPTLPVSLTRPLLHLHSPPPLSVCSQAERLRFLGMCEKKEKRLICGTVTVCCRGKVARIVLAAVAEPEILPWGSTASDHDWHKGSDISRYLEIICDRIPFFNCFESSCSFFFPFRFYSTLALCNVTSFCDKFRVFKADNFHVNAQSVRLNRQRFKVLTGF